MLTIEETQNTLSASAINTHISFSVFNNLWYQIMHQLTKNVLGNKLGNR